MSAVAVRAGGEPAFDYAGLDKRLAADARDLAERMRGHQRRFTADAMKLGAELLDIKERIGHGRFGAWLAAEFGADRRTAQNYMSAALRFGGESETVSHLPLAAVYALASPSTPEPVQADILARVERGEPVQTSDVRSTIAKAKRDAAQATNAARLTPAERDKARKAKARQEREWERDREAAKARMAQRDAARVKAARLIQAHMPECLPELIAILAEAGEGTLANELRCGP